MALGLNTKMASAITLSLGLCFAAHADDELSALPRIQSNLGFNSCLEIAKSEHADLYAKTKFAEDLDNYGKVEFYASTHQLLSKKLGDCDDFALYLYSALRRKGCPAENLQLVYYVSKSGGPSHMNLRIATRPDHRAAYSYYFDVSRKEPFSKSEWITKAADFTPVQILNENSWKILGSLDELDPEEHPYFRVWKFSEEIQQGIEFGPEEPPTFFEKVKKFFSSILKLFWS